MPNFVLTVNTPDHRILEYLSRTHAMKITTNESEESDDTIHLSWHFSSYNDGTYTFTTSTQYAREDVKILTRYLITKTKFVVYGWLLLSTIEMGVGVGGKCED